MTLHIFNPDHDLALASGLENFTAPHAGRQLRHDLAWLPALWAEEGDTILVDDEEQVRRGVARLKRLARLFPANGHRLLENAHFLPREWAFSTPRMGILYPENGHSLTAPSAIAPWGWNAALCAQLVRRGISEALLPTPPQLEAIRELSHRRTSALLLKQLREALPDLPLTGEATECTTTEEVEAMLEQQPRLVLKAPWSSSGRGVRFLDGGMSDSASGWLRNTLRNQGSVMVEPYYPKTKDFGMEFSSDGNGHVSYLGLSLFHTQNGAYTGNLLATEAHKQQILGRYLPTSVLGTVEKTICQLLSPTIGRLYTGPFGIDMMVVNQHPSSTTLHPAVEINLRRTMGHVALSLTRLVNPQEDDDLVKVMRIVYEDNRYKLKCTNARY